MRADISFKSHGKTCRGWLYKPDIAGKSPAIVMSHGLSGVKEQGCPASPKDLPGGLHRCGI